MDSREVFAVGMISLILLTPVSCGNQSLGLFEKDSPWQEYAHKLKEVGLDKSLAGKAWIRKSEQALEEPLSIEVPFDIKGVFKSKSIEAYSYKMHLQEGSVLNFELEWSPVDSSLLFLDIFRLNEGLRHQTSLTSCDRVCTWEVPETGSYVMRVQPELLGEGNFGLRLQHKPLYSVFPVQGKDSRAVQSFYGASREGGIRLHKGVDIFAEKGTPVVSPVRGIVTGVKEGGRGGRSVWVRDMERGYSLYFAHLDTQMVKFGERVVPGQIVGTVGNTGNAKFTPAHLHFGIYEGEPFDPFPAIDNLPEEPAATRLDVEEGIMKLRVPEGNLRLGPSTSYPVLTSLKKNEVVFTDAVSANWYQVSTPDGHKGFVHKSLLEEAFSKPVQVPADFVLSDPFTKPFDTLRVNLDSFQHLGSYSSYSVLGDQQQNVYYVQ